jgi:SSS family transporter
MEATNFISEQSGWLIFIAYGIIMLAITWFFTRKEASADEHLVANRKVSTFKGAFSIAVTWIWAPAIFICSQKSFEQGLPGIFWFTFPNIICFFIFAPIAIRLRRLVPKGYSFPDFIALRYPGKPAIHLIFLIITYGYDLGAIIINSLAGGLLLHTIAGINLQLAILSLAFIAFLYAAWRGLPASIITDIIQMAVILFIGFVLVPWAIGESGGFNTVINGLGGVTGEYGNLFDPWIAFSFGIPATLGLIAGPVADQMFYQRAMAARYKNIVKTFVWGGLLFGIVPIVLSMFGFIAANPEVNQSINIVEKQMVGIYIVQHYLPQWTLYGFVLMAVCGLSSTLDSAYCAVGSLGANDIYKRYINKQPNDKQLVRASRLFIALFAVIGTGIALIPGMQLLWIFLIYGALASSALVPTILCLYWKRLTPKAAFWGPFLSFIIGLPLSIYANFSENAYLVVLAAVLSVLIGLIVCVGLSLFSKEQYEFKPLLGGSDD